MDQEFTDVVFCRSNSIFSEQTLKSQKSTKTKSFKSHDPIKINKKEPKIPYTKKTPIFGKKGYHLDRETSSENNYGYFSKLTENKSGKSEGSRTSNTKRVRLLAEDRQGRAANLPYKPSQPKSADIAKPLSTVIITNKSRNSENIGYLIRKSSKDLESFENRSNDYLSTTSEDTSAGEFQENAILNLIAKSKCGEKVHESTIENSLNNNQIDMRYNATPFNEEFLVAQSAKYPVQSQASSEALVKELSFLETKKKSYLEDLERFRNFEVSQYYFQNMNDFRKKLFKSTGKVLISESFAPNNSNELFNRIEKFDVAEIYKRPHFQTDPEVPRLLSAQKSLLEEVKKNRPQTVSFKGFNSMKHFDLKPEKGPINPIVPPIVRNKSPKKEYLYNRHKSLGYIGNVNRLKTAV